VKIAEAFPNFLHQRHIGRTKVAEHTVFASRQQIGFTPSQDVFFFFFQNNGKAFKKNNNKQNYDQYYVKLKTLNEL